MLQPNTSPPPDLACMAYPQTAGGMFEIVVSNSVLRMSLEARIRSGFGMHFRACVAEYMPRFAYYRHLHGGTGVLGMRGASEESLYLESYLGNPVEEVIRCAAGCAVSRAQIVEVGQFVVDDRGIVPDFFEDLVPFLASQGFEWVCFTGTDRIRAILKRVGFGGLPVAAADQDLVRNKPDRWGPYYGHDPVVLVGKPDDPEGLWCANAAPAQPLCTGAI